MAQGFKLRQSLAVDVIGVTCNEQIISGLIMADKEKGLDPHMDGPWVGRI